jgi:hypothetical protein
LPENSVEQSGPDKEKSLVISAQVMWAHLIGRVEDPGDAILVDDPFVFLIDCVA